MKIQRAENVYTQAGTGAVQRLVGDRAKDVIFVKDFGAIGDGSADDTTALQAALNTGRDVFLPRVADPTTEYYKISAPLTPTDRQRIYGDGAGSIIRQVTANQPVIDINAKTQVRVEGLRLYAVGSMNSIINGCGVRIQGDSSYVTVRGCAIENHRGYGVGLFNAAYCTVEGNTFLNSPVTDADDHAEAMGDIGLLYQSRRNTVRGNLCASGQGFGIIVQTIDSGNDASENVIVANVVRDCRMYGIAVYQGNAADTLYNNIVADNTIRNITGAIQNNPGGYIYGNGIYIQGAEDTVVIGNDIQGTHQAAVTFLETLAPGAIGATNLSRILIAGNMIRTAGKFGITVRDPNAEGESTGFALIANNTVTATTMSGIHVLERGRVKIIGNTTDATAEYGVLVANTTAQDELISIENNTIRNPAASGIQVDYASELRISGNTVKGAATHGIAVANATDILVTGNLVKNHVSRGITIASTVTRGIVSDNVVRGDGASLEGMRLDGNVRLTDNQATNNVANFIGDYANVRLLAVNDTTPSVLDGKVFRTLNTSATTISNFDDGYDGQEITIIVRDANTTFDMTGAGLRGNQGVDWVAADNDTITCVYQASVAVWFCNISDNTA